MSNSSSEEHDDGDGVQELGEPRTQNPSAPPHEVLFLYTHILLIS